MDVKRMDRWVVYMDGQYLIAMAYTDTKLCRWSNSPFNAAMFERIEDAQKLAGKVCGNVRKFNPITGVVWK